MSCNKNIIAVSIIVLIILFTCCMDVQAYNAESIVSDLKDFSEYSDISDIPDLSAKSCDAITALMPENIFDFFLSCINDSFSGISKPTLTLIAIIMLSSIINIFAENLSVYVSTLDLACLLGVMLVCFSLVKPLVVTVSNYLSDYIIFINSISSTLSVILTSSGNVTAAAASSSSAAFAMGITQIMSVNILLPCARSVIALSAINTLSQSINLSGVINFIKSFCTWGMGVLFAIFGGVHSAAVKIAESADSLAIRGIRFSAARLIPVAGNMISESMKTVISSMNIIKSTTGGLGIAYIIYSLVPAVCSVLCVKIVILAALFFSKLMGRDKQTAFFDGINSSLNILLSVCIFASVSGIIIFAVFMNTTVNL